VNISSDSRENIKIGLDILRFVNNYRDQMNILQLCIRFPPAPGGAEKHVYHISKELMARGHELKVYTSDLYTEVPFVRLENTGPSYEGVPVDRFKSYSLRGEMHYVFIPSLIGALLKEKSDIIHAHSYGYFQTNVAALAKKLKTQPLVFTPHFHPSWSMWGGAKRKQLRKIYDKMLAKSIIGSTDMVICHSKNEKELLSAFSVPEEKVRIIPAGIDFDRFKALPSPNKFRDYYDISGRIVLFVGRLASNKGLRYLLDAAPKVLSEFKDTTFVFIGEDESEREKLERKAKKLEIQDKVLFTGHIGDEELFMSAYSACDVFVLPSEYEAFGLVLLEAMASEKPCVATSVGGVTEVVEEGKTGLLVDYGKPAELANAINELLGDDGRRGMMGRAGRERVEKNFTWQKIVDQLEEVYKELS
jgi:glycosyltransferase involved in cell wall biosynthesis